MKTTVTLLTVVATMALTNGAEAQNRFGVRPTYGNPIRVASTPVITLPVVDRFHELRLANKLQRQAIAIRWELYRNYRNNCGFERTYAEMLQLLDCIKHLQQVIRQSSRTLCHQDLEHITHDLVAIDRQFHHIEHDIAPWVSRTGCPRVRARLTSQMQDMGETLHHLMADYGVGACVGAQRFPSAPLLPPRF